MSKAQKHLTQPKAFTLVELLVVIGIIAVLIGILLPALSAARRSASAMKCASTMRQVGMSFQLYSQDNKGYWPPAKLSVSYSLLYGKNSITNNPVYWQNFLAKYVTKAVVGTAVTGTSDIQLQQNLAKSSILWGCPDFTPFASTSTGLSANGESVIYTGYGMNLDPHYPNAKAGSSPPYTFEDQPNDRAFNPPLSGASSSTQGTWFKAKEWTRPAERCLIADGRAYSVECRQPPTPLLGDAVTGQHSDSMSTFWSSDTTYGDHQTSMDIYRHGKRPKMINSDTHSPAGGKISFNILYCDGHVVTAIHGSDAYKSTRMKFPG